MHLTRAAGPLTAIVLVAAVLSGCGTDPAGRAYRSTGLSAPSPTPTSASPSPTPSGPPAEQEGEGFNYVYGPDFHIRLPGMITHKIHNSDLPNGGRAKTLLWSSDTSDASIGVVEILASNDLVFDLDGFLEFQEKRLPGAHVRLARTVHYLGHEGREVRLVSSGGDIHLAAWHPGGASVAGSAAPAVTVFIRAVLVDQHLFEIYQVVAGAELRQPPHSYRVTLRSLRFV